MSICLEKWRIEGQTSQNEENTRKTKNIENYDLTKTQKGWEIRNSMRKVEMQLRNYNKIKGNDLSKERSFLEKKFLKNWENLQLLKRGNSNFRMCKKW